MRRPYAVLLLSSLLLTSATAAPDPTFVVAGTHYAPAFDRTNQDGEHFVEFTRTGETVKTWTTLLVLHAYTADRREPKEAATALARLAAGRDRSAASRVMENAAKTEAMVVFLATAKDPSDDTVEVAAFRYARAADGHTLIAAQYSARFTLGIVDAAEIRTARTRATESLAALPIDAIKAYLAPRT